MNRWTGCPDGIELLFRSVGLADEDDEPGTIGAHVGSCDLCASRLGRLREAVQRSRPGHLTPSLLERWAQERNVLHPTIANAVERHLAACPECREDLAFSPAVLFGSTCLASQGVRLALVHPTAGWKLRPTWNPGAFPLPRARESVRVFLQRVEGRRASIVVRLAPFRAVDANLSLIVELRDFRNRVLATTTETTDRIRTGASFLISGEHPVPTGLYVLHLRWTSADEAPTSIMDFPFLVPD